MYLLLSVYVEMLRLEWFTNFTRHSAIVQKHVYFRESFAKALAKEGLHLKARWPKLWAC